MGDVLELLQVRLCNKLSLDKFEVSVELYWEICWGSPSPPFYCYWWIEIRVHDLSRWDWLGKAKDMAE